MSRVVALGHVGIWANDMDKMLLFYTRVLGMTVTDGGNGRGVFLSAHPQTEHHELLISPSPDRHTNAQQLSFTVGSLDELRVLYHAILDNGGCSSFRITNHGIAIGCYFRDPENNHVEVYWSTGMDYPQPHGEPIDLDAPNAEILKVLENMAPKEGSGPHYYGKDVGKRLPAGAKSTQQG
jgi:catechol 2,3-dioxygenase-like lactoylglutathione lyase family enzyme